MNRVTREIIRDYSTLGTPQDKLKSALAALWDRNAKPSEDETEADA